MKANQGEFIIRVYAIIINHREELLLSDEYMLDMKMTKFPGGGMHYGEGPIDCLRREALEEFGQEVNILEHFYTTDYYQPAMFYPGKQLLSIYYRAEFKEIPAFRISTVPFDFEGLANGNQSFRWAGIHAIQLSDLTFPVDRKVLQLLQQEYTGRS